MAAGSCNYPRAYKPPPENIRRPKKPTPAPPPKKCLWYIEMRYKTPCGKKWKMKKRIFEMNYEKYEKLSKLPIDEIIRRVLGLTRGMIDYFVLKEI